VVAVALPATGLLGVEFMPEDDRSEVGVQVEAPPGATLEYTRARTEAIAAMARRLPEVRTTYATIGGGDDDVTQGSVQVLLHPRAERDRSAREVSAALRREAASLGGATYAVSDIGMGGTVKPIQLLVKGTDAATLPRIADAIAREVRRVPGAADVTLSTRTGQPAVDIAMHRSLAAAVGVQPIEVAGALRAAFAGVEAGDWIDAEGDLRKVVVRLPASERRALADLGRLPLLVPDAGGGTQALAFAQVATAVPTTAPTRVQHENGVAVVTIAANVIGRPLGDVSAGIDRAVAAMGLPAGVTVSYAGDVKDQREVFTNILLALAVAVVGMYFVLVLQFNSWIEPLAILASLPLSAVGVVGALRIAGSTINIMSLIGVILLAGVVAKNAILLLEFAKQLRERGRPLVDALAEAGATRLRPIVMTTVALVAGMVPVALGRGEGAQFRAPLGIAVIGGTLTSTLLTLLVIPVVYALLDALVARLRGARARVPDAATGPLATPVAGPA
jgi:HAE1 family hydrophobic/amphiphilic exporter-1